MATPSEVATIERWLAARGEHAASVTPLTGDVSLRRYFRARLPTGFVVVAYYPVELRPVCRRFAITGELLRQAGVPTPRVLARDCRRGLMLLEDCGERTLYEEVGEEPAHWEEMAAVYRSAVDHLRRFRALDRDRVASLNPPLDASLLRWELRKSWELFLQPEGLAGGEDEASRLQDAFDALCVALGDPAELVPSHRDYMPRNLMRRGSELLVLDHQDLRLAPLGYDLASLLNDSLFPPSWLESELVADLLPGAAGGLAYRRAVVQRTLKAIGNYCDFARRGHRRHLPLIRPSLARAWRAMGQVPELAEVRPRLRGRWQEWLGSDLLD